MYLTDNREKAVIDIIRQDESELFEQVTTLSLKDFERLVNAGVFNESKMNDAVWKFRQFEEPSLSYTHVVEPVTVGGWNVRRDERFAGIIDKGLLAEGDQLTNLDPVNPLHAVVSNDYGIVFEGVRHESPDLAALAAGAPSDTKGWEYWSLERDGKTIATLADLHERGHQ